MTKEEADDRAGGKEYVDAMELAFASLHLPLNVSAGDVVEFLNDSTRAKARFLLLSLQDFGFRIVRSEHDHHYVSTACQHGHHEMCGKLQHDRGETGGPHCKYCPAVCACPTCRHSEHK